MEETSKCYEFRRNRGDFENYLVGDGIDIGAGTAALIVPNGTVRAWERSDGDGQLLETIEDQSVDFVYSSHCLEHLTDVHVALTNWVRVLKPGGFLYVIVPDYTLFEHHQWPSVFNPNHTYSFSLQLTRAKVGRTNHFHIGQDLKPLVEDLDCEWISAILEDQHYDYNLGFLDQTKGPALAQICFIAQKAKV